MKPVDKSAGQARIKRVGRRLEGWALALALAAGGALVGFAFSEYRLHQVVVDLRDAQREEVTRLTDLCVRNMSLLAPKVEQAAKTANAAAATANSAAETAADAADTSASAASVARSAAVSAARHPSTITLQTPTDLGRAVETANRKVREAHQ